MCESMRSVTRLVLFVLCCVQCGLACFTDGPEECYFTYYNSTTGQSTPTWCSWTSDGGWEHSPDPFYPGYSARLAQDKDHGVLRSREACPVTSYCLDFIYYFNVTHGGDIDLSVYVTNTTKGDRVKLWSLSSSVMNRWDRAYVPIFSDVTFSLEFEAVRRPNSSTGTYVHIDNLFYYSSSLCRLFPPNATVVTTTSASSPITAITTTTTTPTTKTTTTTTPTTTTPTTPTAVTPTANVGIILGSVIAVLVIIIVVLVIILYRRNKLPEIQTCFNRKQSSRAKRGVGSGDHGNAVYVNDVTDDDDDDDPRMAVEADTGDYVDVADTSAAAAAAQNMTRERHAVRVNPDAVYVNQTPAQGPHNTPSHPDSSVGERSPPIPYATLETPPTENVYSVDPTCSENTNTGLGARSPPNVYLSIGHTPDGGRRY